MNAKFSLRLFKKINSRVFPLSLQTKKRRMQSQPKKLPVFQSLLYKFKKGGNAIHILKNASWLFFDKFIRLGFNFVLTAWIARYLGAEQFGQWNYAIAFVTLFSFFSTMGLYNLLLRDFVQHPELKNKLLGTALLLKFSGSLLTLLFSMFLIFLFKPADTTIVWLVFLVGLGYVAQSLDVVDFFFQSQLKAQWISLARFASFMVFGSLKVIFIYLQFPLIAFLWLQMGELALSALLLLLQYQRKFGDLYQWTVDLLQMKRLLREGMPIIFAEIAILLYMRIDQVMVGEMVGNVALGNYSAAVKLSEIWYLFPGILCSSLFPSIIQAKKESEILYQKKLQQLYDLLAVLSLGIAVLVSFTAPLLIQLFYGNEFEQAASILVIHIWAGFFVFLGMASSQQLVVENLMQISFYRTLMGMMTSIVLNIILIPLFQTKGAALATLGSQMMAALISIALFKKSRHIFCMALNSLNLLRFINK